MFVIALIGSGLAAKNTKRHYRDVVELVDTIVLETIAIVRAGASPAVLTIKEKFMKEKVKFVSYTGKFPVLCSGILTIRIGDKEISLPQYSCVSDGYCGFTHDWEEYVGQGDWRVNVPEELAEYKEEIEAVMNANVPKGCCGGCL